VVLDVGARVHVGSQQSEHFCGPHASTFRLDVSTFCGLFKGDFNDKHVSYSGEKRTLPLTSVLRHGSDSAGNWTSVSPWSVSLDRLAPPHPARDHVHFIDGERYAFLERWQFVQPPGRFSGDQEPLVVGAAS